HPVRASAGPSPERPTGVAAGNSQRPLDRRAWLAGAGLVLLHLSHPLTWQVAQPALWFPPLGIGLVLLAWLGPRALGLVLADAFLILFQSWAVGIPIGGGQAVSDTLLFGAEVWTVWWCYHRLMEGSEGFTDPRSTIRFLLFAPGLTVAVFAVAHA